MRRLISFRTDLVIQKATFKIRRKIILAFLFSLLSGLIFSAFSFQVYREIDHRLRLLELTDDLFQTILELRRVEKNFFLYRQVASVNEAETYLTHAREIYHSHESEVRRWQTPSQQKEFSRCLANYQEIWARIKTKAPPWKTRRSPPWKIPCATWVRNY